MSDKDFYLNAVTNNLGEVKVTEGGSGYFSTPSDTLDPSLFDGDHLKDTVRTWILDRLYGYWEGRYAGVRDWSTAWLAGSGISYQWAADRSNGDLDVLIGVDFPAFFAANQDYVGFSEDQIADVFNSDFRKDLWPQTAQTQFGTETVYEVTFYVNPHSADIRDINPYAAYNLNADEWTVTPPVLPQNPETLYPKEYWDQVHGEKAMALGMVNRYNDLHASLNKMHPATPGWRTALYQMGLLIDQATAMFDDIHLGRKQAFAPTGKGYGDFHNFRWQAHKRYGTVQALASLRSANKDAREQYQQAVHGQVIDDAQTALNKATMWNWSKR